MRHVEGGLPSAVALSCERDTLRDAYRVAGDQYKSILRIEYFHERALGLGHTVMWTS